MLIALFIYWHILHVQSHMTQKLQPAATSQQVQPQAAAGLQVTTGGTQLQHTMTVEQLQ